MIVYEHPFNEHIRTCLRLERLLARLQELQSRSSALDHHFALLTLFEVAETSSRSDLKAEICQNLIKRIEFLQGLQNNADISQALLSQVLTELKNAHSRLQEQQSKPASEISANEWLSSIRSRIRIPGGTCEFDLPSYHAWLQGPANTRQHDLHGWMRLFAPLQQAIATLLKLLRNMGQSQMMVAKSGQLQIHLPQERTYQMLRLTMDNNLNLTPEISANRLLVSLRMMQVKTSGKASMVHHDIPFEICLCA